jgi:hypothetical protein
MVLVTVLSFSIDVCPKEIILRGKYSKTEGWQDTQWARCVPGTYITDLGMTSDFHAMMQCNEAKLPNSPDYPGLFGCNEGYFKGVRREYSENFAWLTSMEAYCSSTNWVSLDDFGKTQTNKYWEWEQWCPTGYAMCGVGRKPNQIGNTHDLEFLCCEVLTEDYYVNVLVDDDGNETSSMEGRGVYPNSAEYIFWRTLFSYYSAVLLQEFRTRADASPAGINWDFFARDTYSSALNVLVDVVLSKIKFTPAQYWDLASKARDVVNKRDSQQIQHSAAALRSHRYVLELWFKIYNKILTLAQHRGL